MSHLNFPVKLNFLFVTLFFFPKCIWIFAPKMVKSASETRVHFQTLCRILFAIVAKWSINAHLGKWWEENNDDFLLANVSTHVRKEGKQKSCWKEGIRYHGIQRTFDFYAAVSNACKYDSCGKKNLFSFILFTPTFFLVRERCQYSTCIQFPGSNVPNTYQCCALTRASKAKSHAIVKVDIY